MRAATYDDVALRIQYAAEHGFRNLTRPVRVAEVARLAGYSDFHFQRLFAALAGESWAAFHRRLRLERGAALLQNSRRPVFDVALDAGFEGGEPFIRAFRDAFGVTPGAFRKRHRETPLLPTSNGAHAFDPKSAFAFAPLPPGASIEFSIRSVEPMALLTLTHRGPLQFISSAWLRMAEWAQERGIDLKERTLVTYAEDLDDDIAPEDQVGYVALDDRGENGLDKGMVGGGEFLVARHIGPGHLLADFWFRVYATAIPEADRTLRRAAAFQIYPDGLFVTDPATFVADIYVPLESA